MTWGHIDAILHPLVKNCMGNLEYLGGFSVGLERPVEFDRRPPETDVVHAGRWKRVPVVSHTKKCSKLEVTRQ